MSDLSSRPAGQVTSGFGASSGFGDGVPAENDDPARWLGNTPLLQFDHPKIRVLAMRLTQLQPTARQKALACVNYVSSLPFGAIADSTGTSALAVLKHGRGDCHTKSTLLVALLRASGIASRMRFISLPPHFLRGIIDHGDSPVEHACTEVYLEGRWLSLDSYVVDTKLAVAAKQRLRREGSRLGYGMHVDGSTSWNGSSHSFAQFSKYDADSKPLRDWGAYDDPYQFYSSVPFVKSRLNWSSRVKWIVGASLVNRKVKELRGSPS
ncbi:MAG: transglutaminase-like domain-containing protein [Pseudomonadota bacterium]